MGQHPTHKNLIFKSYELKTNKSVMNYLGDEQELKCTCFWLGFDEER